MYFYYLEKLGTPYPGFDPEDGRPRKLEDIGRMVTAGPAGPGHGHTHVFFKDMSYYIADHLVEMMPLMRKMTSVFLIRDPRFSFASYVKLDPEFTLEEGGLEAEWNHYEMLRNAGIPVMVIDAATITADPVKAMRRVWEFAGMPFVEDALSWQPDKLPDDWQQTTAWHQSSMKSTGFIQRAGKDPDEVFEKAAETSPQIRDYLSHHQEFYDRLKEVAVTDL